EPDIHAATIVFHRCIDELLDLGKGDNLVELPMHLGAGHSEDGTVEENILTAGEFGMEAGANLQQRRHAAAQHGPAARWLGDARQNFEERRLASAIPADHADD